MTRNVVLLVLDTVRKDVFDEVATRLRERSDASVERCYAASSWTLPSHASMLGGQLPSDHGVHALNPDYGTLEASETVFETVFAEHRTLGVSANGFLSPAFDFDRFFDEFVHLHGNENLLPGGIDVAQFLADHGDAGPTRYLAYLREAWTAGELRPSVANAAYMKLNNALLGTRFRRIGDYGARVAFSQAKRLVRSAGEDPYFLFVNVVDAHQPHENGWAYADEEVPDRWSSREADVWAVNDAIRDGRREEYAEYLDRYERCYRAAVSYLDRRVDALLDSLLAATDRETTVIVTADHGEELGREGERGLGHKHPTTPIQHVPLEVYNAPEATVEAGFSHLDLPALLEDAAEGFPEDVDPPLRDGQPVERVGDISPPENDTAYWDRVIRGVYEAETKWEWDSQGAQDCYDVEPSRERLSESGVELPEDALAAFRVPFEELTRDSDSGGTGDMDAATQQQLSDLGYL